ncbi:MAG TPA: hypothetical protein VMA72_20255 [Streptosporangiaceae bacterium]|nr:hypothetical protein [Streptosporangiaceae bacterium]
MATELKDQIHLLMERGIRPVSAAEVASQSARRSAFPPRRVAWSRRTVGIATGAAAAACAVAVVAAQVGGPGPAAAISPAQKAPAILTAAAVRHLATASRLALAHAGQAVITSQQTLDGVLQQTSTDRISFTGRNWNDSVSLAFPAGNGHKASTESAINRVVDGQAYDYFVAADGLAWYHDTGPNAVSSLHIPDPRKLLAGLAPDASFVKAGETTISGVPVEHLQATVLSGLPAINLPDLWNEGKLTALDVWVDARGVVRKMSLGFDQTLYPGTMSLRQLQRLPKSAKVIGLGKLDKQDRAHIRVLIRKSDGKVVIEAEPGGSAVKPQTQLTTVTASFLRIGQPQAIRVPAHAIPTYGLG